MSAMRDEIAAWLRAVIDQDEAEADGDRNVLGECHVMRVLIDKSLAETTGSGDYMLRALAQEYDDREGYKSHWSIEDSPPPWGSEPPWDGA